MGREGRTKEEREREREREKEEREREKKEEKKNLKIMKRALGKRGKNTMRNLSH